MDTKKDKLIIPSAKLVPEGLRNIGNLPGIIYPLNERIVFDYLWDQYNARCSSICVLCYEAADIVKRRLNRYLNHGLEIQKLSELKDLGYTIYCALNDEADSVIINFADTIVFDSITDYEGDVLFYAEQRLSDTWTYFEEHDGVITEIYDKISFGENRKEKKKLFVGVFKISDAQSFKRCLENAFHMPDSQISSFYRALCLYSEKHPVRTVQTENWFDIGHSDTYFNSELEVKAREFNHITIDKNRGILRKSSDNKEKFLGEIQWYLKLPADIEYVRPRIFAYSLDYNNPYVSMEYYSYHTVHELFLYGDLSKEQWRDIFQRISFICNDFRRYSVTGESIPSSLEDMYLTKTLERLNQMKENQNFESFFQNDIIVNQKRYQSLEKIIEILKCRIPEMLYDVERFNIIHGDLCFSNIMIDRNLSFVKVIDPRGTFGAYDIYGDFRYELAKLFHSIDGKYDFIIKDIFSIQYDLAHASIEYAVTDRKRDFDIYNLFLDVFQNEIGNDLKKIELIEALLFLSMIPLHGESLAHQLVMLGTGLDILNRIIDIEAAQ